MRGRSIRLLPVLALLAVSVTGCASSGGGGGGGGGDPDLITQEDLQTAQDLDGYEAVRRLRPRWLRPRSTGTRSGQATPVVYIDGLRRGDLAELRSVRASDIQEVRFLSATEATTRFGTDHTGGAIVVSTRR